MKAPGAMGMIPNAFGTSLVPERWWVLYNLVPAYGGRESNILFSLPYLLLTLIDI
jgi:hypothetical protein